MGIGASGYSDGRRAPRLLVLFAAFSVMFGAGVSKALASAGIRTVGHFSQGIHDSTGIAMSPDESSVYFVDQSLLGVYSRDVTDGELSYIEAHQEPRAKPFDVVVSPDGAHVYVVDGPSSGSGNELAYVYARDATTGGLTLVSSVLVPGFVYARSMVLSADGAHAYLAGAYAYGVAPSLLVFSRDGATGALTLVQTMSEHDGRDLAFGPGDTHLYMVREHSLRAYTRDAVTGGLTLIDEEVDNQGGVQGLRQSRSLAVSPDGLNVYTVGTRDAATGALAVFGRDPVTGELSFVEAQLNGIGGVTGLGEPRKVLVSPDGAYVYTASVTERAIASFSRDPGTGALTFGVEYPDVLSGYSTLTLAMDASGTQIYTESGVLLERDVGTGALTPSDVPNGSWESLEASPDGVHLYGATGDPYPALRVYERDASTGQLTWLETYRDGEGGISGLGRPLDSLVSPDGATVHVASEVGTDMLLVTFERNGVSGALTQVDTQLPGVGGVPASFQASGLLSMSADSKHLYVSSSSASSLYVFARDAGTGALTFVEEHVEGLLGVSGLEDANAVAVDPSGSNVYCGSAVFARDPVTGALSFVEDEPGEVRGIAISGDGAYVYRTTSFGLDAFSRALGTGELTLLQKVERYRGGLSFSDLWSAPVLSADETHLYVRSRWRDLTQVAVFSRKPGGRLAFVDVELVGAKGLPSLGWGGGKLVRAEEHLYLSLSGSYGAGILEAGFSCAPTPLLGCRSAGRAKLTIKDSSLDLRDKLSLKLLDVDSTTVGEFYPAEQEHYAVCAYDESGSPTLAFAALAPADWDDRGYDGGPPGGHCAPDGASTLKPCWTQSSRAVKYKDRWYSPDGLQKIVLKASETDRAKIIVTGSRDNLQPSLPLGLPLRVQLQSATGLCWETVFDVARKNDIRTFSAKTP